ncbi:uncharacterized protein LOC142538312 isoform X2 [Primulina tabacum]|uniref:uncharacterized protein LOC142538312 isoform X2 n=1 Tax=Primulina tabacum TaxID=48773 RepID=UPI003F598BBC
MEKNCQKRRQPLVSDSVIARLMGIDELPHQQPLHKYQRVLSDGYICKSASVGLRQGSTLRSGRSRETNNEMLQGVKRACRVKIFEDKNHFVPDKYTDKNTRTVKMVISNEKPAVVPLSNSTSGASHEDRKAIVTNGKHGAPGNVLRYLQKLDNSSSTDQSLATVYTNDFFTIQSDVIDKSYVSPCVRRCTPMLEKTTNYCGVTKLDLLSRSEIRESSRPESGNHCDLAYKGLFDNDTEPLMRSFFDRNRTTNRTSRQRRCRSNLQDLSRPASEDENYLKNKSQAFFPSCPGVYYYRKFNNSPRLLLYKSSLGKETFKKNYERQKIKKEIEKIEVSGRGQTHVKMEALCTQSCKQSRNFDSTSPLDIGHIKVWEKDLSGNFHHSESETTKESLSAGNGGNMDKEQDILKNRGGSGCDLLSSPVMSSSMLQSATSVEISSYYSSRKCSENNTPDTYAKTNQDEMEGSSENDWCREIKLAPGVSRPSNLSLQRRFNDALADVEAFNGGVFSKISGDQQPESNSGFISVKDASSFYSQEASTGEASLYEFSEEEPGYSNCSRLVTPEFQKILDGPIGQCSPDSILESFDTKYPSIFECFESTEEAYSEGFEMVVSGNEEEKEEGITDLSYNSGKVHRWLGDDESRNFCYIVDVLDEAGCFKDRPIIDIIQSWDCLEYPISPLVFAALEKKYGTQACWQKSDRQLLFDLVNSGLMTILERLLNFHSRATSCLQRHFTAGMKRDEVENMLWKMVISLEREKSSDASEKVVEGAMKWWEVDDKDTNVISRELEISLFEELVMESISLWIE